MHDPLVLTAIEVEMLDGYLLIPRGMTPIHFHVLGGRMIAHVENWDAEKECEPKYFDMYLLKDARKVTIRYRANGEGEDQDWFDKFGEPVKEARRLDREWDIRERTK